MDLSDWLFGASTAVLAQQAQQEQQRALERQRTRLAILRALHEQRQLELMLTPPVSVPVFLGSSLGVFGVGALLGAGAMLRGGGKKGRSLPAQHRADGVRLAFRAWAVATTIVASVGVSAVLLVRWSLDVRTARGFGNWIRGRPMAIEPTGGGDLLDEIRKAADAEAAVEESAAAAAAAVAVTVVQTS